MKDRRLGRAEIKRTIREIEHEQGVHFPKNTRVVFANRMVHEADFGSFMATLGRLRGAMGSLRIRVFGGVTPEAQRIALKHELREAAGVIKGRSVAQAHRLAQKAERKDLARSPLRTTRSKPYRNTIAALRGAMRSFRPTSKALWANSWVWLRRWLWG